MCIVSPVSALSTHMPYVHVHGDEHQPISTGCSPSERERFLLWKRFLLCSIVEALHVV